MDAERELTLMGLEMFPRDVFQNQIVLGSILGEGNKKFWESGRNVQAGYVRGVGLQSGKLAAAILNDPDYQAAIEASSGRSLLQEHSLMNLFLIIKHAPVVGNIIEFGSYNGGSALFMACVAKRARPGCKVFALDTFQGMPTIDPKLDIHYDGQFPDVNIEEIEKLKDRLQLDNLFLKKGLFNECFKKIPYEDRKFFLSHIDCDLYESVRLAISLTKNEAVDRGFVVFDDPLYSTCLGAMKAVEEELVRKAGLHAEQAYPHLVYRLNCK